MRKEECITTEPINLSRLIKNTADYSTGACLIFLGTVRNYSAGCSIKSILYEAHKKLATKTIKKLEKQIQEKYKNCKCKIIHRIGHLKPGEISLAIIVRTPHRNEAYKASRWLLESVKKCVPVWKKEYTSEGIEKWVKGKKLIALAEMERLKASKTAKKRNIFSI